MGEWFFKESESMNIDPSTVNKPLKSAQLNKSLPENQEEISSAYIKFRSEPKNIKLKDQYFCNQYGISLATLQKIKDLDPSIESTINGRPVTDDELSGFMGLLTRLCYEKAFAENIPVKSLEGLANALVNLMKQRQLETGRPTEIITIKEDELKKKTPTERYQMLMGYLRRSSVN